MEAFRFRLGRDMEPFSKLRRANGPDAPHVKICGIGKALPCWPLHCFSWLLVSHCFSIAIPVSLTPAIETAAISGRFLHIWLYSLPAFLYSPWAMPAA